MAFPQRSWQARRWRRSQSLPAWLGQAQSAGCYPLSHPWNTTAERQRATETIQWRTVNTNKPASCEIPHLWIMLWEWRYASPCRAPCVMAAISISCKGFLWTVAEWKILRGNDSDFLIRVNKRTEIFFSVFKFSSPSRRSEAEPRQYSITS